MLRIYTFERSGLVTIRYVTSERLHIRLIMQQYNLGFWDTLTSGITNVIKEVYSKSGINGLRIMPRLAPIEKWFLL